MKRRKTEEEHRVHKFAFAWPSNETVLETTAKKRIAQSVVVQNLPQTVTGS